MKGKRSGDIKTAYYNRLEEIAVFNENLEPRGYHLELIHQYTDIDKSLYEKKEHNTINNREGSVTKEKAMGFDCFLKSNKDSQHCVKIFIRHSNDYGCFFKKTSEETPEEYLKRNKTGYVVFIDRKKGKVKQIMTRLIPLKIIMDECDYVPGYGSNKNRITFPYMPSKDEYHPIKNNLFGENILDSFIEVFGNTLV